MSFLRVVEVFPPSIRSSEAGTTDDFGEMMASFIRDVRHIKNYADVVLVASLKDPRLVTVSSTATATLLARRAGVNAAPVILARDANRREISSTILGAFSAGVRTLMLAWGDRGLPGGPKNVYDFRSLSDVILTARKISAATRIESRLLAPVNLDRLTTEEGVRLAKSRLEAGADFLLAEPPTADAGEDFERHIGILDSTGLRDRVLLGVFSFKDRKDVLGMETRFGWRLPPSLKRRAASEAFDPIDESRALVRRMRQEGLPGVYISTRGSPEVANLILG